MVAVGLGEMPGVDMAAAADVVAGESDLVFLPHLPAAGGLLARTLSLMPELPVDARTRGWVLTPRPHLAARRLWDRLEADLEACESAWPRLDRLKVQVMGPWSLAASIELFSGHRAVTDPGAFRDITEILVASVARHVARFDCPVQLQIDEPLLGRFVSGGIPGTSDFDALPPVAATDLGAHLHAVVASLPDVELVRLHLGRAAPVWEAALISGAEAVSVSRAAITTTAQLDAFGAAVSDGVRVGLSMPLPESDEDLRRSAQRLAAWWDTLGLQRALLATAVDIHPENLHTRSLLGAASVLRAARTLSGMLVRDAGDL